MATIRRKRRWGDVPADRVVVGGDNVVDDDGGGDNGPATQTPGGGPKTTSAPTPATAPPPAPSDPKARAAALQASIRARLEALKARTTTTTSRMEADSTKKRAADDDDDDVVVVDKTKKRARVFELDMSTTTSDLVLERKRKTEDDNNKTRARSAPVNPYLAHVPPNPNNKAPGGGADGGSEPAATSASVAVDPRLVAKPDRPRSRPLNFVVPGTYVALGEKKRQLAANAEESGYISGRKAGNVLKSVGMGGSTTMIADDDINDDDDGRVVVVVDDDDPAARYGATVAGRAVGERLPARADAPESECRAAGGRRGGRAPLAATNDWENNDDNDDDATMSALIDATSAMPYAVEWWDAELLPGKLRKELAGEEGRAIASRMAKNNSKRPKGARRRDGAAMTDDANGDGDDDDAADARARYRSRRERHDQLIARCYRQASISHSKTHGLTQHPVPVLTPAQRAAMEASRNRPPTLHLTKAERKRHRKLRRAERLRETQDMQAAGLVPPPEPRLTLANYMKVLGDQAILDPSRMEAAVVSQIQGRKLKHERMNAERKLTKEQRAARHARKLEEDTSQSVCVALFYVKDMGHPYHRTKVDLNAQQNGITGGVLECEHGVGGGMALVVAEGGERAVKRYTRLMTVRMRWKGEDFYEDEEDEDDGEGKDLMVGDDEGDDDAGGGAKAKVEKRKKFNPNNECELIWSGMAIKRAFHSFMFQNAESSVLARKILEAKGVAHYWDLAVGHAERKAGVGSGVSGVGFGSNGGGELKFRLGDGDGG
ncbi:hypothetical protein ACHAW5_002094 [Stephanodiscus triporus]|uniref:Uncharacterized protein n=1 Tax=Stephanodiscus triporus TaxID=2934178 RepID=A0ABD3NL36_9STRA